LRIACMPRRVNTSAGATEDVVASKEIVSSIALMAGIPALWYLFFTVFSSSWRNAPSEIVGVVFFSLSTILVMLALMRLVALLMRRYAPKKEGVAWMIWMIVLGLLAPLGGLLLNADIPFPFTFQHPAFYPLAVLNGLLLIVPTPQSRRWRTALFLARAALFPYVFYFFIIFLPFTPFFLPALLFFGAGVLILAPTALFLVQGSVLWKGFQELADHAGKVRATGCMVLAFGLLPSTMIAQAIWHRATLHRALDYVYPGEKQPPASFTGSRFALRMVLDNQTRTRAEASIPFISTWYNNLVFDGLMLPSKKLDDLYSIFFQSAPPYFPPQEDWGLFSNTNGRNRFTRGSPPPLTGQLTGITWSATQDAGFRRIHADIALHNPGNEQAEYADTIRLPPAALITGFWLHIEDERVPGVIFEKKTAMWVYQTIRDRTRRDPGILVYKKDGTLDFRVFPLERDQRRRVEIEFSIPDASSGEVLIGAEKFALTDKRSDGVQVVSAAEGGIRVVAGADAPLPAFRREAAVYILVHPAHPQWEAHLREAVISARTLHDVSSVNVRWGDHELGELPSDETAVLAAARGVGALTPSTYFQARAVRHVLWHALTHSPTKRPVIIFAPPSPIDLLAEEKLDRLMELVPDAVMVSSSKDVSTPHEVVLLRIGEHLLAALPGTNGWQQCFPFGSPTDPVTYFDPIRHAFVAIPEDHLLPPPSGIMQTGTALWIDQVRADTAIMPPQKSFAERVRASRDTGVMLTSTSYIVVEQKAQWKALKEKEAAKLSAHSAFDPGDIIDTPEPHPVVWLFMLVLWGAWKKWRPRKKAAA